MATEVLMPKLGATMENGTIIRWYKKEGDSILVGEPLVEIMTDKINLEVEAPVSGTVIKVLFDSDAVVDVQQPIAYIGESGETVDVLSFSMEKIIDPVSDKANPVVLENTIQNGTGIEAKVRATPAAKKLARMKGIDLRGAKGSGPNGRIHLIDVQQYLQETPKVTPLAKRIADEEEVDLSNVVGSGVGGKIVRDDVLGSLKVDTISVQNISDRKKIKLEGIRKIVADRMTKNAFTAPHVTLVSEVDMTKVLEIRKHLIPIIENKTDLRLSITEILVKVTAYVLKKHPMVNASLVQDSIILNSQVNVGVAVAVSNGLVVPVVKDADLKGLQSLTVECKNLAKLAREGKLKPDQVSSGTFTISNLGMYAVDAFTPIINSPETAILGVGRINEKPVGVNGEIALRPMMTLSLSFDHRVIDGAPAAAFLTELKETLENPYILMV